MNFGILLINKPKDRTSFSIVAQIRRITGIKKVGHTGTLDPFATGLLPICIGKATKLVDKLLLDYKTYEVKMKFGEQTDSGDDTGNVTSRGYVPSKIDINEITNYILQIDKQIPPKFSALKVNGRRAYKLAREHKEFELKERSINITKCKILKYEAPYLRYEVTVSKGTYIRVLSEMIASKLNSVAVTTELIRKSIGPFEIDTAVSPDTLNKDNWKEYLLPITTLFPGKQSIKLRDEDVLNYVNGRRFSVNLDDGEEELVVSAEGEFLGFCNIKDGILHPKMVFADQTLYTFGEEACSQ